MFATNRQKKVLKFFNISYTSRITVGAAGWEIGAIWNQEENRELWRRYLYLTRDFDSDSEELKDYCEDELIRLNVPDGWNLSAELENFRREIISYEMRDGSPYDNPQPDVFLSGKSFVFTGKFSFGTRKDCQSAVIKRGGFAPNQKTVSGEIDYLVVGNDGSVSWKFGSYGTKIRSAILSRREHGKPAIISELHWAESLKLG